VQICRSIMFALNHSQSVSNPEVGTIPMKKALKPFAVLALNPYIGRVHGPIDTYTRPLICMFVMYVIKILKNLRICSMMFLVFVA
jgi:hypothetical protein